MHIPDSDKPITLYNLDMIISVGYRVNSKRGIQFRIWATNVLRKHLVEGYTLNQKRLEAQAGKIKELQEAVSLLSNVVALESISDETKGIIQIISEYSRGLGILDDYDHERLSMPGGTNSSAKRRQQTNRRQRACGSHLDGCSQQAIRKRQTDQSDFELDARRMRCVIIGD